MSDSKSVLLVAVNSRYIHSNTAVYYLHCILESAGIDSQVESFSINDEKHDILRSIFSRKPKIVCFSCYIWNISLIYSLCHNIKQIDSSITIVLGGPEVTYEPQTALAKSGADLIVRGEGESIIAEVINSLLGGKLPMCGGCYYSSNGRVIDTGIAITDNLDDIPTPFSEYMMNRESRRLIYYEASRGCPYNCIYCLSSATKGVRYFSLERVLRDLKTIMKYSPKTVKFTDRSFNTNVERTLKILKFIKEADTSVCFHLEIFPTELQKSVVNLLKSMPIGRVQLEAGIQSVNIKTLRASRRIQDPHKALVNMEGLIKSSNMHVHLDIIAGLPYEDSESFKVSFNKTIGIEPHMLQLGFLKLLKGTEIREAEGFSYDNAPPYEVLATPWLSFEQLSEIKQIEKCVELFYNTGKFRRYLRYMHEKIGNAYLFYKELAQHLTDKDVGPGGISRDNKYKILAEFAKDDTLSIEYLRYDFMSSYSSKKIPIYLGSGMFTKENIFSLLKTKAIRSRYFPKNQETPSKKLYKVCNAGSFIFDDGEEVFLFNYTKKNLVTGLFPAYPLSN